MAVKIVHLYPKELNLYGDCGNVLCLVKRLEKRGYAVEVINVGIGDILPNFDILFIGGGQDKEMQIIQNDLKRKSQMLSYSIENGKSVLAICGGYQLLGKYYKNGNNIIKLSNALDFYTVASDERKVGNIVFDTELGRIVGFENHAGITHLSQNLKPFGKVVCGYGNDGINEGVWYKNTIGTYAHGPVLPKNPELADYLIKNALGVDELKPIDDAIELKCKSSLIKRFTRR